MEDPRTRQPSEDEETSQSVEVSKEDESDAEAIAKRVVDVFWESFHAGKDEDS